MALVAHDNMSRRPSTPSPDVQSSSNLLSPQSTDPCPLQIPQPSPQQAAKALKCLPTAAWMLEASVREDARLPAADELRASEERYALAIAGSTDGIWDWNILTNELFLSERTQRLYGLEPGPTLRPMAEWLEVVKIHPDDIQNQIALVTRFLEGVPPYEAQWRILHPDGIYRWVRVRGLCVRDAVGIATRGAGSVSDIDQLVRAEAALLQSKRLEATGTLAGGIAHDFNNLLAAILGYGEMALLDSRRGSRLRHNLENIVVASHRGRALVDQILAFSRSGIAHRAPVQIGAVVREVVDLVSSTLPAGVRIETKLNAESAAAVGNVTQFHQVLMNLATNAVQAMPAGGVLRIALDVLTFDEPMVMSTAALQRGSYVCLTVADDGIGIVPEILDRIFDPYFTTKDARSGTGLGLSLVHGIVTDANGAIDVASRPDAGSVFSIYLPCAGTAVADDALENPPIPRGNHQQILVVDDESSLVTLISDRLIGLGYVPVGFTASTEALAAFRAHPERFDAVITDARMPDLSGSSLIRELRATRGDIPILMTSGFIEDPEIGHDGEDAPAALLKKPVSTRDLATSLARVLPAPAPAPRRVPRGSASAPRQP